jgi:hypothetical protein
MALACACLQPPPEPGSDALQKAPAPGALQRAASSSCALPPKAPNRYRVAGPYVDLNFGLVEIDWEATSSPLITMKAVAVDGGAAFEHAIADEELRPS